MAMWKRVAIERFPELRVEIQELDSIGAFWVELTLQFGRAYRRTPWDDSMISRIYSFADWCVHAPRNRDAGRDPLSMVVCSFFEDIWHTPEARKDIPRWLTYDEVAENSSVFSYLGEAQYADMLKYMKSNRHKYVPRPRDGSWPWKAVTDPKTGAAHGTA